jgi:hypothetical protein
VAVRTSRVPALRRLLVAVAALVAGCLALTLSGVMSATGTAYPAATPQGPCRGPQDALETDIQGRVPLSDYRGGRYRRGYRCNTVEVAHQGASGGFKVLRYRDSKGNVCAFYDSTLLFPKDLLFNATKGLGVVVLDMNDPAHPKKVAQLTSPAMLSPHESLMLNQKRGLLGAVLGNPITNVGVFDLYDVRTDCRNPRKLSSTTTGLLGHESGFAPDGKTFYSTSAGGMTLAAIDVTNPRSPKRIFTQLGVNYHGLRLSNDGNTMYVANLGTRTGAVTMTGLRVLDVSEIQAREPDPQVRIVSDTTWPEISLPQVAEPFKRNGRRYVLEVDEYANFFDGGVGPNASVGAARIIDVTDRAKPKVTSTMRLAVHQPGARSGRQKADPGASIPVQGYAAHYCSVPYRDNPKIVACSMIVSGLRIFDISDLRHPREVAYFNRPTLLGTNGLNPLALGAYAMSQPAWDVKRTSIWYTDGNSGLYVVKLAGGVQGLLARR